MDLHSRRELMESMSKRYRQASRASNMPPAMIATSDFPEAGPARNTIMPRSCRKNGYDLSTIFGRDKVFGEQDNALLSKILI
jgi:hypothetical protein